MYDPDEEDYGPMVMEEEDEYCGACESHPCMCSDREQTSTTLEW